MVRNTHGQTHPQAEDATDLQSEGLSDLEEDLGDEYEEGDEDQDQDPDPDQDPYNGPSDEDEESSAVAGDSPYMPPAPTPPRPPTATPPPMPSRMPPPLVPPPVIHAPRDHRAEATRKRMEENVTLQREEKYELLGRLQYLVDEKGFKPFRVLGPDDALEDIRYEVFRANREMTKKRNVKMMQKALVTVGAGVEMMNSWYNPLKLRLDGFSKSLLLSIREYDEIFEELHWKYCDSVAMPPEMKLVMTLGSSLWFFHMSNHTTIPATPAATTNPPAPPPFSTAMPLDDPPQRRMNGPRMQPSAPDLGGPAPAGMDMTSLLSGLGMVQTLMTSGAKF